MNYRDLSLLIQLVSYRTLKNETSKRGSVILNLVCVQNFEILMFSVTSETASLCFCLNFGQFVKLLIQILMIYTIWLSKNQILNSSLFVNLLVYEWGKLSYFYYKFLNHCNWQTSSIYWRGIHCLLFINNFPGSSS